MERAGKHGTNESSMIFGGWLRMDDPVNKNNNVSAKSLFDEVSQLTKFGVSLISSWNPLGEFREWSVKIWATAGYSDPPNPIEWQELYRLISENYGQPRSMVENNEVMIWVYFR
jgi:hypothetical protein